MPNDAAEVVVLGSCIADIAVSVPSIPTNGQTIIASEIRFGLGGKGANQAIACARLGLNTAVITSLGRDESGRRFERLFVEEELHIDGIYFCDAPTGIGVPIVTDDGGKAIIVLPGASLALSREDVSSALRIHSSARVGLAQLETSVDGLTAFLSGMRARDALIVLNAAPCLPGRDHLFSLADVLVTNIAEAEWLVGSRVQDPIQAATAAKQLRLKYGVGSAVVTLGAQGSVAVSQDGELRISAAECKVRDRTGAGDAYCAALTATLARGLSLHDACVFASDYGARACERAGAIDGMPRAHDLHPPPKLRIQAR